MGFKYHQHFGHRADTQHVHCDANFHGRTCKAAQLTIGVTTGTNSTHTHVTARDGSEWRGPNTLSQPLHFRQKMLNFISSEDTSIPP
jgi:hypothetical protein